MRILRRESLEEIPEGNTIVMSHGKKKSSDYDIIKSWPWFGGMPGRAARGIFALWVTLLVMLAV